MARRPSTIRVYGPMPPPVVGLSRVTAAVTDRVRDRAGDRVVVFDTTDSVSLPVRLRRLLHGLASLLIARRRAGAVYVGGAGGELLWYQVLVVALARVAGHRVLFHHHNYSYLHTPSRAMATLTRLGTSCTTHVVLGETMAADLHRLYPSARHTLVCSNAGLMPPAEPGARRERDGTVVLGHLSNLTVEKGLDVVLDTTRALLAEGRDVRLVLAGPCFSDEAQALVDAAVRDLGPAIEVTGPVPPDRVDEVYRRIDLFVLPSSYANETEPLVVLDAMRLGVPCLALDTGCVREVVGDDHVVTDARDFRDLVRRHLDAEPEPAAQVAERFTQRRETALEAQQRLVDQVVG